MRTRGFWLLVITAGVAVVLFSTRSNALRAQTPQSSVALTGQVTSAEEGPMEGVLVSAKKTGSTITITVVSDRAGPISFPVAKLDPGEYALRIRAVGYELRGARDGVEVAPQKTTTARSQAPQGAAISHRSSRMRNGSPACPAPTSRKRLSAPARTATPSSGSRGRVTTAEEFVPVIERMASYPPLAFPLMPQDTSDAHRVGGGEDPLEQRQEARRRQAEYLSTRQSELVAAVELRLQDASPPEGQGHAGHLHGVRSAEADETAARRHRGFGGHGVVRELRRADPRQARSENRARSPNTRSPC